MHTIELSISQSQQLHWLLGNMTRVVDMWMQIQHLISLVSLPSLILSFKSLFSIISCLLLLSDYFRWLCHVTLLNLKRRTCFYNCYNGCQAKVMLLIHQQETWSFRMHTYLVGSSLLRSCPSSTWCQKPWNLIRWQKASLELQEIKVIQLLKLILF